MSCVLWPMAWPAQPCNRCGVDMDIADGIVDFDPEGRFIGTHHEGCPPREQ